MVLGVRADDNESTRANAGHRGLRFLPILGWARHYDRSFLRSDLIAGVTVTALVVPKNLGYAEIARVPIPPQGVRSLWRLSFSALEA